MYRDARLVCNSRELVKIVFCCTCLGLRFVEELGQVVQRGRQRQLVAPAGDVRVDLTAVLHRLHQVVVGEAAVQ
eukprot:1831503-Pyramimonas_sp.AAC.1